MATMDFMAQAVSLARLAVGQVSPNPAVGAVVVKDGAIVGRGYTQPPGLAHAEVVALEQAGDAARGGVMYVTLEPCCHHGRTPPCTVALIEAGVSEVQIAMLDPNPLISGKGEAELRSGGVGTQVGPHEADVREVVEAYVKHVTCGVPFVTAKFAMSLDGKIATRSGDSKWISSAESRRYVHSLRYASDAIMVGVNTVLADDPRLTFRCGERGGTSKKQPLRVVVDGKGRTPATARLFSGPGSTLLALGRHMTDDERRVFDGVNVELVELPTDGGLVNLVDLLRLLGERGVTSVLVEGGGILLGSMFDHRLVDKVIAFIAPMVIGGAGAGTPVAGEGVVRVTDAVALERVTVRVCDDDVMVTGYVGG